MSSSYKVTVRSIANLDSLHVIILDYLILPLLSLIMFLLIAFNSHQDYSRILLGTIITSGISSGIGIINSSSVYDQNIGIYDDIVSIRPKFSKYWLPKLVIAGIVLTSEILILGGIGLISLHQLNILTKLIIMLPFIILIDLTLGLFCTIWGIKRNNPYWLSNIVTGCLVLVSGVIIPVAQYPQWLKWIAELFPVSDLLDAIIAPNFINTSLEIFILKGIMWGIICYLSYAVIVKRVFPKNN